MVPSNPPVWRRILRGLTISTVTLGILAGLLEVGVRVFVPEEVFHVFANTYQSHDEPAIGFTLKPDFRGQAFGADLRTNHLGFRGPDRPQAKPAGVRRIALIGDSHAFGYGVDYEQSLGRQLERRLNEDGVRCEVWNFAVSGYNTRQQLAVFRRYALPIEPDLVILVPCNNDHEPARWVDADGWMRLAKSEAVGVKDTRIQPPQQRWFERSRRTIVGNSRLAMYLQFLWMRYRMRVRGAEQVVEDVHAIPTTPPAPGGVNEELQTKVKAPLTEMISICSKRSIPVLLAPFTLVVEWRRMFFQLHDELGVPVFELCTVFPEAEDWGELQSMFSLGWDSHLGVEAHRRWGRSLQPRCKDLLK